jgi:hypothetical protein
MHDPIFQASDTVHDADVLRDSSPEMISLLESWQSVSRRALFKSGLIAGAAALLGGCQTNRVARSDEIGPVWPDKRGLPDAAPLPPPPQYNRPAPVTTPTRTWNGPVTYTGSIIPRSRWTNQGVIAARINPMTSVKRITVHHEGNAFYGSSDQSAIARRLSNIRSGHINRRPEGFADIGYHYIVDPAGRVWAGRDLRYQGAHVERNNENNLGIMVMGNFEEQQPTRAQLETLEAFVVDQMHTYNVPANRVFTHREIGKSVCPGRNLQRFMVAQRSPAGTFARA